LGIEVKKLVDGLLLTQEKYASDLLQKVGMQLCRGAPTPLSCTYSLFLADGEPLGPEDSTRYYSIAQPKECVPIARGKEILTRVICRIRLVHLLVARFELKKW
jgi:hypothetical protein